MSETSSPLPTIKNNIRIAEQSLGIISPPQAILEATLLIDAPYLRSAALTEEDNPEHAFGLSEWLGHLAAQKLTQDYGDQPLDPEFMIAIHKAYVEPVSPEHAGGLRSGTQRGGIFKNNKCSSYKLPENHIEALQNDRFASFEQDPNESDPHVGKVKYPTLRDKEAKRELEAICTWYNREQQDPYRDDIFLGAELHRRVIQLHPFEFGVNGRPSRALLNWSLRNSGLASSAIRDFRNDLSDPLTWRKHVASGIVRYERIRERVMNGHTTTAGVLGLEDKKAFYDSTFQHRMGSPPPLTPGKIHIRDDHMLYYAMLNDHMQNKQ